MNVLAHLHLASLARSSLLGNVLADFVKGDPYKQYPPAIAAGMMLHRRIDFLTDHAEPVKQALALFPKSSRRIAGIVLDIVWDHFLVRHWAQWSPQISLAEFVAQCEQTLAPQMQNTPPAFQHFMQHLWQESWLVRYGDLNFIEQVLSGMSRRYPKLPSLSQTMPLIRQHQAILSQQFNQLYPLLTEFAQNYQSCGD